MNCHRCGSAARQQRAKGPQRWIPLLRAAIVVITLGGAPCVPAQTPEPESSAPQSTRPSATVAPPAEPLSKEALAAQVTSEPRRVLDALGIGESELAHWKDGEPVADDERGTLTRLLYRAPAFSLNQLDQWSQWTTPWDQLSADTEPFRGAFCRVSGHVERLAIENVPPVLQEQFPFNRYYRLQIVRAGEPGRWIVYSREIPKAWQQIVEAGQAIREQVATVGMFVKSGPQVDGEPTWILIANRIGWYPTSASGAIPVDADLVWLAAHGVDAGRLLQVTDRTGLSAEEREAFYQTLAAVGTVGDSDLSSRAALDPPLHALLLQPEACRGELFTLTGRVRRVIKIEVSDPALRRRYGLDHYFEVELFVDSDVVVRIGEDAGEGQTGETVGGGAAGDGSDNEKVFSSYPIAFCVRSVPQNMPAGELVNEPAQITGMYFKLWAYASEYLSGAGNGQGSLQVSPLLIGQSVDWQPVADASRGVPTWLVGAFFLGLAALVGLTLWIFYRDDRRRPMA